MPNLCFKLKPDGHSPDNCSQHSPDYVHGIGFLSLFHFPPQQHPPPLLLISASSPLHHSSPHLSRFISSLCSYRSSTCPRGLRLPSPAPSQSFSPLHCHLFFVICLPASPRCPSAPSSSLYVRFAAWCTAMPPCKCGSGCNPGHKYNGTRQRIYDMGLSIATRVLSPPAWCGIQGAGEGRGSGARAG